MYSKLVLYILVQYISKWLACSVCPCTFLSIVMSVPCTFLKLLYKQFTVRLYTGPVYSTVVHKISLQYSITKTRLKNWSEIPNIL